MNSSTSHAKISTWGNNFTTACVHRKVKYRFVHLIRREWKLMISLADRGRRVAVSGVMLWSAVWVLRLKKGGLIVAKICRQQWVGVQMTSARICGGGRGGVERGGVGGWVALSISLSLLAAPGSRRSSPLHIWYPAESFLHQTNSYNCPRRAAHVKYDSYFISAASWQMTMQLGWIRYFYL